MSVTPSNEFAKGIADGAVRARSFHKTGADALDAPIVQRFVTEAKKASCLLAMKAAIGCRILRR